MSELHRFLAFFRSELAGHFRQLGFWFALALLGCFFGPGIWRSAPAAQTIVDLFQAGATPYMMLGALTVVLLLGAETAAECRRPGVGSVLWTKPFSSLTYAAARQTGLFAVLAVLLALPFAGHWGAALARGRLAYHAEPSLWAYLYLALPAALLFSTISVWARSFFDHHISSLTASAVLAWALYYGNHRAGLGLAGVDLGALEALPRRYYPGIGCDLAHGPFLWAWARTAAFAAFFVALTACHLSRVEPRPIRPSRSGVFGFPTFRGAWSRMKFDPNAGGAVLVAFVLTAALAGTIGAKRGVAAWREERARQAWAVDMLEVLPDHVEPGPALRPIHVEADLTILDRERIEAQARLQLVNPAETPIETAYFGLFPGLELRSLSMEGEQAVQFRRFGSRLEARLPEPAAPGTTHTLVFDYAGKPGRLRVGQRDAFSKRYDVGVVPIRFGARAGMIETSDLLPVPLTVSSRNEKTVVIREPTLTSYTLRVRLFGGFKVFGDDSRTQVVSPADGSGASLIITEALPQPPRILTGAYETFETTCGGVAFRLHCFPGEREMVETALAIASPQVERIGKVLGPPPGGRLTLVETQEALPRRPPRRFSADWIAALREFEEPYREGEPQGYGAYQETMNALSDAILATWLDRGFWLEPTLGALQLGLGSNLREDMLRDGIRPTDLSDPDLFIKGSPWDSNLVSKDDLFRHTKPLVQEKMNSWRGAAVWRMLRLLLGDEGFCGLIQDVMRRPEPVSEAELERLAEKRHGKDLDWFFAHWLHGGGLPKYEIPRADATMVDNKKTSSIDYKVEVVVANAGQGIMPAPIMIQTERDEVTRPIWLDAGTSATLELLVPDRPEYVIVDPDGWILQEAWWDDERKQRTRPYRKVRILEDYQP
jgi:hypothetical protein